MQIQRTNIRKIRLSVIIPLYNCGAVILRCLESIDHINDMEIFVIDDGSTDDSASVVESYAINHPWVKLIHKKNGGVSSARNMGIENALGEYIMFVDADDYLIPGGLAQMVSLAHQENADVIKYLVVKRSNTAPITNHRLTKDSFSYHVINGNGNALAGTVVSDYHVVDGLFKRELLIANNIRFHEDLYLHEDDVFMAELYAVCKHVIATNLPLYHYVVCSTYSHTHNTTPERTRKIIDSELLAVQYRHAATAILNNPIIDSLERIKAMRFVYSCSRNMLAAGYPFRQYREMLNKFKPYGCYPLQYRWLNVCLSVTPKLIFKTFLCNHPRLAYLLYRKKT